MAFSSNDQEKLEKAIKSPEMRYLDYEVQAVGKTLSLFDACFTDDTPTEEKLPSLPKPSFTAPAAVATASTSASGGSGKSDLFAKPASKAGSTSVSNASASPANKPPPPPVASPAAHAEHDDYLSYGENGECAPADLGDVDIPDYDSDTEIPGIRKLSISEPAMFGVMPEPEPAVEGEDEDEIDLS